MSTLNCTIKQAEPKTSKKGNAYWRLAVTPESGGADQWFTYFGTVYDQSLGAKVVLSLKEMGDGVICDDYNIIEPGQAQAVSAPAPMTATHAGAPGHRDLWIFAEVVFQHWIAKVELGDLPRTQVKAMVADSIDCAIFAHETFAAYDKEGYSAARNLIQTAFPGSPAAKVADIAERATAPQAADTSGGANVTDTFDDDIPF